MRASYSMNPVSGSTCDRRNYGSPPRGRRSSPGREVHLQSDCRRTLKPVIDSVFPFDETIRGYERLISGKTQGKVMVRVAG